MTFKPNTDDMREAPSLVILPLLQARGAEIRVCDPQAPETGELPGVLWCATALEAATGADVLVALTEWNEFRALDLNEVRQVMRGNVLVDLRNLYQAALVEAAGLAYHGIGRPSPRVTFSGNGKDNRPNGVTRNLGS